MVRVCGNIEVQAVSTWRYKDFRKYIRPNRTRYTAVTMRKQNAKIIRIVGNYCLIALPHPTPVHSDSASRPPVLTCRRCLPPPPGSRRRGRSRPASYLQSIINDCEEMREFQSLTPGNWRVYSSSIHIDHDECIHHRFN